MLRVGTFLLPRRYLEFIFLNSPPPAYAIRPAAVSKNYTRKAYIPYTVNKRVLECFSISFPVTPSSPLNGAERMRRVDNDTARRCPNHNMAPSSHCMQLTCVSFSI